MDEYNRMVNARRAQLQRILDLQAVLKEVPRQLNERSADIVYPDTYQLVDELPI